MTNRADDRLLGPSPRARRSVFLVLGIAAAVLVAGQFVGATEDDEGGDVSSGPRVGGDLHAIAEFGPRVFVGGHGGAGSWDEQGGWAQIPTLDDKDVMAWARSGDRILAGGHTGLYTSTDDGATFSVAPEMEGDDVHALGASGEVVYLASPAGGVSVSTDGGETFAPRGEEGAAFMGTIWVDPRDEDVAMAPSMQDGVMKTTDGGATWSSLGGPMGAMSVSADSTGRKIVAVGMGEAQESTDGGLSWNALALPEGTSAATYTSRDGLLAAVLSAERARVLQKTDARWTPLG